MSSLNKPIGERELFEWASKITKTKVAELQHLRNGLVFLKLLESIWPNIVRFKELNIIEKCTTRNDYIHNWTIIEKFTHLLDLPESVADSQGIINCKFEPVYYFLVMLYFLSSLKKENDFSVDFSYPIPGVLAEFLQSDKSIACLQIDLQAQALHEEQKSILEMNSPSTPPLSPAHPPYERVPSSFSPEKSDGQTIASSHFSNMTNFTEKSIQTDLTQRKIDKMLEANIDMRSLLQNSQQIIEKLKSENREDQYVGEDVPLNSGNIQWKNDNNKAKGELLITRMKYENESLNRQISFLREEKDVMKQNFEKKIADLCTQHETELQYERDRHNITTTESTFSKLMSKMEEQSDYQLKLRKLEDEIAFEADQIQHVIDEDFSEELLRLRQIRVIQNERIHHLENENKKVEILVHDLRNEIQTLQTKVQLLQKKTIEQQKEFNKPSDTPDMKEMELRYQSEIEHLKNSLIKLDQKPVLEEFETSQKMERLEAEILRLKRTNDYLRQRKIQLEDRDNSSQNSFTNNHSLSMNNANNSELNELEKAADVIELDETLFADMYQLIKSRDVGNLEDKFWQLSRHYERIRIRLSDIVNQANSWQQRFNELSQWSKLREAELEAELTTVQVEGETTVTNLQNKHMKELSELSIQIQLLQERIIDLEEESFFRESSSRNIQNVLMEEDRKRFCSMYYKMMSIKTQMRGYKVREPLWTSLIENQRKRIETLQEKLRLFVQIGKIDSHYLIQDHREEQESEKQVAKLLNELQVLTSKSAMESASTTTLTSPTLPSSGESSSVESDSTKDDDQRQELMLVEQRCQVVQQQLHESKNHVDRLLSQCQKLKSENEQFRQAHTSLRLQCDSLSTCVGHLEKQTRELTNLQGQLRKEKAEALEKNRIQFEILQNRIRILERELKENAILSSNNHDLKRCKSL